MLWSLKWTLYVLINRGSRTRSLKSITRQQKRARSTAKRAAQTANAIGKAIIICAVKHRRHADKLLRYFDSFVSDNTKKQPKKLFTVVRSKRNDCFGVGFMHDDA